MFDISSQREIPQQGELYSRVQESVVILAVSLFGLQHAANSPTTYALLSVRAAYIASRSCRCERHLSAVGKFSAGFVNVFGYGIDRIRIEQVRNRTVLSGIVRTQEFSTY